MTHSKYVIESSASFRLLLVNKKKIPVFQQLKLVRLKDNEAFTCFVFRQKYNFKTELIFLIKRFAFIFKDHYFLT